MALKSTHPRIELLLDYINPVLVKELRQSVRNKGLYTTVVGISILAMIILLTQMSFTFDPKGGLSRDYNLGQQLIVAYIGLLAAVTILFCIVSAGIRFHRERNQNTLDLMYCTTMRPRTIIFGKYANGMILAAILFSVFLPFFTVCYFLGGIKIFDISVIIGGTLPIISPLLMCAIFVGAIPVKRSTKQLITFGIMIMSWMYLGVVVTIIYEEKLTYLISSSGYLNIIFYLLYIFFATLLFFFLSIISVSLPMLNRVFPFRLFVLVSWLVFLFMVVWYCRVNSSNFAFRIWFITFYPIFICGLLCAPSERSVPNKRLLSQRPAGKVLRGFVFPLFSGCSPSILFNALFLIIHYVTIGLMFHFKLVNDHDFDWEYATQWLTLGLYVLFFISAAMLIRSKVRLKLFDKIQVVTSKIAISIFIAVSMLSGLIVGISTGWTSFSLFSKMKFTPTLTDYLIYCVYVLNPVFTFLSKKLLIDHLVAVLVLLFFMSWFTLRKILTDMSHFVND